MLFVFNNKYKIKKVSQNSIDGKDLFKFRI